MEQISKIKDDLYQIARLALEGSREDVSLYIRRVARRLKGTDPELTERLRKLVSAEVPGRGQILRESPAMLPVDLDSRLELARTEVPAGMAEPLWGDGARDAFRQVIAERSKKLELADADLQPTRSLLLCGAPGVGKTMSARWLASEMRCPLLTLDLSAVMSSFLGRTGSNVRNVLDYAKSIECVLLLDEFDAIAKRRDDVAEIGELKRLVTVILQEIESWPSHGILIAATNHPELLDPAVWRRFDMVVEFALPEGPQIENAIRTFLAGSDVDEPTIAAMSAGFQGMSYSDMEREILRARREAIIRESSLTDRLHDAIGRHASRLPAKERKALAIALTNAGVSERMASALTGVHRATIHKVLSTDGEA
ncbi:MAG: ATP-binding protein [Planctomycetaceae bacterium]|nr:ATP-binding protein [Planctomycetaceae bacterium]